MERDEGAGFEIPSRRELGSSAFTIYLDKLGIRKHRHPSRAARRLAVRSTVSRLPISTLI